MDNMRTLESTGAIMLLGNGDERIMKLRNGEFESLRGMKQWHSLFYAEEHTRDFDFSKLDYSRAIEIEGKRLALMHATPDSISEEVVLDEYTLPWRTHKERGTDRVREILQTIDADYWISGHSHRSFVYFGSGKVALNPGSVGLTVTDNAVSPDNMPPSPDFGSMLLLDYINSGKASFSPVTQYARLTMDRDSFSVIFRVLKYDYKQTIADLIDSGLAKANKTWMRVAAQGILTGCSSFSQFTEILMRLNEEHPDASAEDIWNKAGQLFPFEIPPLVRKD